MQSETIISAVIAAIIGSITSFIFVFLNDKRKEHREDKKELDKQLQERFEKRPELKIISCGTDDADVMIEDERPILKVIVAKFEASVEKNFVYANYSAEEQQENRICTWYKLENVGKTDISLISLITAC